MAGHFAFRGAQQVKTWADPSTGKPDQTAANFIDNANNLRPTEYAANLKVTDMTPVLKLTFKEERGADFYTSIGRKGGEILRQRRGPEYYSRIGRAGALARKRKAKGE